MKKIWMAVAGVVLVLALVGVAGCASEGAVALSGDGIRLVSSQQEGIWVNGTGEVSAVPDVAILSIGVEAQQENVSAAQDEAAVAMDKVMAALKAQGVADKDIQTQYYNIQRVTRWDNDKQQEIVIGYRVTNTVTAKVRDVTKTGTVIDAVVTAGGDLIRINNIGFDVEDMSPYYEEARQLAVENAATKAAQLADLAGIKLGKPTYISESSYTPGPIYRDAAALTGPEAVKVQTPISPGEMKVNLMVQLAYAIDS